MFTRRAILAAILAPAFGCAWLTGTRRRGRRRGRRRERRDQPTTAPTASAQPPQLIVEELEVGDTLVIDEDEEFEVLAFSPDASRALLRDARGQKQWAALSWER